MDRGRLFEASSASQTVHTQARQRVLMGLVLSLAAAMIALAGAMPPTWS